MRGQAPLENGQLGVRGRIRSVADELWVNEILQMRSDWIFTVVLIHKNVVNA